MKKITKIIIAIITILVVGTIGVVIYFSVKDKQKNENNANKVEEIKNEILNNSIDETSTSNNTSSNKISNNTNTSEDDVAKKEQTDEEMYQSILNDYKKAMNEFNANNEKSLIEIEKYSMVNSAILLCADIDEKNEVAYTFYDIDKNGIKELIVGIGNNNEFYEGAVYSYNKNTNKSEKIFYLDTMERGTLQIYENGVIFSEGSGGAALNYYDFGKIAKDGISYEKIESIEEEYSQDGNSATYKDSKTNKVLNYKNSDEIKSKYLSNSNTIKLSNYNKL